MGWSTGKRIAIGTALAGTLDIAMAIAGTLAAGHSPVAMLGGLASGPFPGADALGLPGAALGLLVHYAIMAVMVAVFVLARDRIAAVRAHTVIAAALYGVVLWLVMYGAVLPLRFHSHFPSANPVEIAKQLFAHVILVGMSIAWVARK